MRTPSAGCSASAGRASSRSPQSTTSAADAVRALGACDSAGVELDLKTRTARCEGSRVELTAREFTMLETFMRHPGQVS